MTIAVEPRLAALVAMLAEHGRLRSPAWIEAFSAVPRHRFVPEVIISTADGYRRLSGEVAADQDEWLALVYSDSSLVVQAQPHAAGYRTPSGEPLQVPTSSSTMPSLMARMLEALDVGEGMRVLEIGTGTGYNAALLAHRLGSDNVVSIDIDPELVDQARKRLTNLGYTPTLIAGDGAEPPSERGPFDRIIATAAVPDIPPAWIRQLAPNGRILANLRGDLSGANLCLLSKAADDNEVIGPILPIGGHFMWLRPDPNSPHRPHEHTTPTGPATTSRTSTKADPTTIPVDDEGFRFLLQLQLRGARGLYRGQELDPTTRKMREAIVVSAADGSRATCFVEPETHGVHALIQSGPRRLWDTLAATYQLWLDLSRPAPGRFGVVANVVNANVQFVWLDNDHGWNRWPLPLT